MKGGNNTKPIMMLIVFSLVLLESAILIDIMNADRPLLLRIVAAIVVLPIVPAMLVWIWARFGEEK